MRQEMRVTSSAPWSSTFGDIWIESVSYGLWLAGNLTDWFGQQVEKRRNSKDRAENGKPNPQFLSFFSSSFLFSSFFPSSFFFSARYVQSNGFNGGLQIAGFARMSERMGLFATVSNPFAQYTAANGQPCTQGMNHVGDDLPSMPVSVDSVMQCQEMCNQTSDCAGYVALPPGCEGHPTLACYLKKVILPLSAEPCPCAGVKPFPPAPPQAAGVLINATYNAGIWHNASINPVTEYHAAGKPSKKKQKKTG
jgi:hypothetical protein